jgi:hypothetical protein
MWIDDFSPQVPSALQVPLMPLIVSAVLVSQCGNLGGRRFWTNKLRNVWEYMAISYDIYIYHMIYIYMIHMIHMISITIIYVYIYMSYGIVGSGNFT